LSYSNEAAVGHPSASGQRKDNIDENSFGKSLSGADITRGYEIVRSPYSKYREAEEENSMTDEDRKQLATSFIAALRVGDANGFRAIMTDDVVWTLPGTSLVSGIAEGVEGILKRARTIVDHGANVEIQHVVLGYEGVALLNGRILDEYLTTVCTLRESKIARLDT
jgi:ketosteroid isomerase-like protein